MHITLLVNLLQSDHGYVGDILRTRKNLRRLDTFLLPSTQIPCIQGSSNGRCGNALFSCLLHSPTTCSFHSSLIQDVVNDMSFTSNIILLCENLSCDFDKVRF